MKKLLILILIALVLTATTFTIVKGFSIGSIQVLGIIDIKSANEELDEQIAKATKLADVDYNSAKDETKTDLKKLQSEKERYEDMVSVSTDDEVESANLFEKYEIESLWVQLGNHATAQGVVVKLDITNGTGGTGTYDLHFTTKGTYVAIADYISAIENDSKLGFKIEEFSMQPGDSTTDLQATFTCKNISIKEINEQNVISSSSDEETTTNSSTNKTNTTNTTSNSANS